MCGILGYVGRVAPDHFERALHRLTHRGPDGYGIWSDGEAITLGHRRLAILDTSERGRQPLEVLDRYVITFNGEIYNFKELRAELEKDGVTFRSDGDTEVLVHAFVRWKEDCLRRFNGMWAFAIWDKVEKTLFISRDRFGKKPLFLARRGDDLAFSSEMKALAPFLKTVRPSPDFQWCVSNVIDYEATEKCLIDGIERFPAGSYAWYKPGASAELNPVKFWETLDQLEQVPRTYEQQVERFRELFIDACRLRMRSDVPIGTALSGGLDSSATICTMAHLSRNHPESRMADDWQHAFVATFPGTPFDETKYARQVVDHLGIKHTLLTIDPQRGISDLENDLYLFEEIYRTSPVPMMATYRAVREHGVRVTLDGHGADEALAGYGQDAFRAFHDCGLKMSKVRDILATYKGLIDIDTPQIHKTTYDLGFYTRYMGGKGALLKHAVREIFGKNPKESIKERRLGRFNSQLYKLFHQTMLPTLLRNYDRYAMAHGIEIRMPFMDHRLVSFMFSLPWDSKMRGGFSKRIVRDAIGPYMPKEVAWRTSKIGFSTPIVDWMKGPWKAYLLDLMSSADFKQCALIDPQATKQQVMKVIEDPGVSTMAGEQAWMSLSPYLWERSFLKRL